jgi:hypothetical protein
MTKGTGPGQPPRESEQTPALNPIPARAGRRPGRLTPLPSPQKLTFAAYALALGIVFPFLFRYQHGAKALANVRD